MAMKYTAKLLGPYEFLRVPLRIAGTCKTVKPESRLREQEKNAVTQRAKTDQESEEAGG